MATVVLDRKRSATVAVGKDEDLLTFVPLGAGQEVGRSCHILKFKGRTIMVLSRFHGGDPVCIDPFLPPNSWTAASTLGGQAALSAGR